MAPECAVTCGTMCEGHCTCHRYGYYREEVFGCNMPGQIGCSLYKHDGWGRVFQNCGSFNCIIYDYGKVITAAVVCVESSLTKGQRWHTECPGRWVEHQLDLILVNNLYLPVSYSPFNEHAVMPLR